jgi:CheY-like chemotaxis protein
MIRSCSLSQNPDLDLLLIDMNMPVMRFSRKLIREFNNKIIIIAQTANGMEKDREDAIAAGCSDYKTHQKK